MAFVLVTPSATVSCDSTGAVLVVPVRLVPESNIREHWTAKARRVKAQREVVAAVLLMLRRWRPTLPCVVRLTRVAPRSFDAHDNLPRCCKACVDQVSDYFGVKDDDKRVRWEYAQERGPTRTYGLRLEIRSVEVRRDA